jgi:autotransporter translocation and assembly factor TamB
VWVKRREPFRVDNNLVELEISPDLHIIGTAAEPKVQGRAEVDSGTVSYGQRTFEVTRGIVDFVNPYEIEPNLDIKSEISIRKWRVYLGISGTPENLKFELNSNPSESDGDILSLMLFGQTSTELAQGEGAGSASAGEMLGLLISPTIERDLKKATGLDILKAETVSDTDGDGQDRVRVTFGKNLTERLQMKYSTESKEGEQINTTVAEYKFLQNVLVSGYNDSAGKFGGALRYRLEFR